MIKDEDILGLKYPIKDFDNKETAVRTIKRIFEIENMAGIGISTKDSGNHLLFLPYWAIIELIENNKNKIYDSLPVVD